MNIATVGLDIAKQFFQVHGVDPTGQVALRKRLRRNQVSAFFANLPQCTVGLEACRVPHVSVSYVGVLTLPWFTTAVSDQELSR